MQNTGFFFFWERYSYTPIEIRPYLKSSLRVTLHFTSRYGFPKLNVTYSLTKKKMQARIFQTDVLTSRIGKRNQPRRFIWCVLWGYWRRLWLHSQEVLSKFALISKYIQKITIQNIWNYWLKEQPKSNWKICILSGLPSFYLKIWLSEVKCYVPFI